MTVFRADDRVDRSTGTASAPSERLSSLFQRYRREVICLAVLCVLSLLTWLPRSHGPIDLRWDAGVYYVLGTSLAEGKGYRLLNEPGEIADIQYPPLLPAIVALHQVVLGTNDQVVVGRALRVTWILLSVTYVALAFILARMFLPLPFAFVAGLVCLLGWDMYFLSTVLFTELPFALVTTLFAILYYRAHQSRLSRFGAGASAVAAFLLRTVGVAALGAWVLDAFFQRRVRAAAVRAAVALVPLLAWQGYIHHVQSGDEYRHPRYAYQRDPSMFYNVSYATNVALKDPFQPELGNASARNLAGRFLRNALALPTNLGEAIGGTKSFWGQYTLGAHGEPLFRPIPVWTIVRVTVFVLGILTLVGIAFQLWNRQWAIGLYVVLSLAALGTSPWPAQVQRYLAPLVPFLVIAMFGGAGRIYSFVTRLRSPGVRLASAATMAYGTAFVVIGSSLAFGPPIRHYLVDATYQDRHGGRHTYTLSYFPQSFAAFQSALTWLRAEAPRDAIVAVSMPQWAYLETGLTSVMTPFQEAPAVALGLLDSVPVSYVILETTGSYNLHLPAVIRSSPDRWQLVYTSSPGGAEVYRRIGRDAVAQEPGTR